MNAVEFLKTKSRMCNSYTKMTYCGDCKNLGCPVAIKYGVCYVTNESDDVIDGIVETVKEWGEAHPIIKLTEQQKTAIRGRIAEGYLWAIKYKYYDENNYTWFYSENPKQAENELKINFSSSDLYEFVTIENSPIYLPDLLEEEE